MRVRGARVTVALALTALLLPACDDGGAADPGATAASTGAPASVAGPAWREIATVELSPVGPGIRPYMVADPAAWEALADELQIARDGLDVDFVSNVVIVWAYGISGSCNEDEISDVAIDTDAATVTLELAGDMWESATCTDDFNQRLRVTTVRRAALPTPPFDVVLPGNCVNCRLTVDSTDLEPGPGWRPIAHTNGSFEPGQEGLFVVGDAASMATLWNDLGPAGTPLPDIDFGNEIAAMLADVDSTGCIGGPVTGVEVDATARAVSVVVDSAVDEMATCMADFIPTVVVVAIDRADLPPFPFRFAWGRGEPVEIAEI